MTRLKDSPCLGATKLNLSEQETREVLITGAGGFVGGRVTEMAYLSGFARVRAGLRRWSSAARIARFPVDMKLCDVLNREQLSRSIKGCDAVVHCAVGGRDVIVEGTSNALDVALKFGVKRFIHISSAVIYGKASGEIDETFPPRSMGDGYADAKIDAEKICWEYEAKGLPIVILRPSIVYGPFCNQFTVGIAEQLCGGELGDMKTTGEGFCNLIYVDDLVYSIFLSIRLEQAVGQTFNVNGPDQLTWNDYFKEFGAMLGIPNVKSVSRTESKVKSTILGLLKPAASYVGQHYGDAILRTGRTLGVERRIEGIRSFLKTTPSSYDLGLFSRKAYYSYAKAARILGYAPRFTISKGLSLSVSWLAHEGYLKRFQQDTNL
jgi:nucleoside-diphosphate-sugar epimerase